MTTLAATRAKMGSTTYYLAKMKASLLSGMVQTARDAYPNWDNLTEERRTQRADDADLDLASSPKSSSKSSTPLAINPNSASRDDLVKLPGVGEAMANRIIEGRPFQNANDLSRVPGIGPKTLEKLRPHLSFPPASPPPAKPR